MKSSSLVVIGAVISILALAGYGGVRYMTAPSPWPNTNDLDLEDTGGVIDGFQLTAAAKKSQVYSGEPVWIHASLKNLSAQTVYMDIKKNTEKDFFLVVQDEQHKLVAFTKYMDWMKPYPSGVTDASGTYNIPLKKNEVILFKVRASQLYKMTAPGKYLMTLKYKNHLPVSQGPSTLHYVVSNTVFVEILHAPPRSETNAAGVSNTVTTDGLLGPAIDLWTPTIVIPNTRQSKTPQPKSKTHK